MSLLEDRVLRIIELKEQGWDSSAIAEDAPVVSPVADSLDNDAASIETALGIISHTHGLDRAPAVSHTIWSILSSIQRAIVITSVIRGQIERVNDSLSGTKSSISGTDESDFRVTGEDKRG